MPQDAPPNGSAREDVPEGPWSRVAGMQAKLHRWAAADPGRRFDDLFNFVHDPATLYVAYCRVEGNRGANTPGVDGMTVRLVGQRIGVREFLDDLRVQLKAGTFRPLPVRQRLIPKPGGSGKLRKLGIPAVADRVAQTVVAGVLEERAERIFHRDSYGYRPGRGALDAVAVCRERCWRYDWVVEFDIRSFFDSVPWELVTKAVSSVCDLPWVLLYVKRWLAAPLQQANGTLTERHRGTPQGGLCSAEHNPPYEQRRVMRSAGFLALVTATLRVDRCT